MSYLSIAALNAVLTLARLLFLASKKNIVVLMGQLFRRVSSEEIMIRRAIYCQNILPITRPQLAIDGSLKKIVRTMIAFQPSNSTKFNGKWRSRR